MSECEHTDVRAEASPRYRLVCQECREEVFDDRAFGLVTFTTASEWPELARAEVEMLAELDEMQKAHGFACEWQDGALVMRSIAPPESDL